MDDREKEICNERHGRIQDQLNDIQDKLEKHDDCLVDLKQFKSGTVIEIRQLCLSIEKLVDSNDKLVSSMKWSTRLALGTLLAFFFWYIQGL